MDILTATHRCDRCGAQAYVQAMLEAGPLLLCAHHARVHGTKLRTVAIDYLDETDRCVS